MTRYADPTRCPDCHGFLPAGTARCPSCHLDLGGPAGHQLFAVLTEADRLLTTLRAERDARRTATQPRHHVPAATGAPAPSGTAPAGAVRGSSVPRILLGLGALCLLVAALVFLTVTWSRMGVGGRTATLLAFTAATGGLTAWAAHQRLRAAVESLGLVTLGLVAFDVLGARNAGWLGDPSTGTFVAVLGVFLYAVAVGGVLAVARTPVRRFVAGETVAGAASLLVLAGLAAADWSTPAVRLLVATLGTGALVALTALVRRHQTDLLLVTLAGTVVATLLSWLALAGAGVDQLGSDPSIASVWGDLDAWALVVAAALAFTVAVATQIPLSTGSRLIIANTGLVAAVIPVLAPAVDETATTLTVACAIGALVLAAAVGLLPRPWSLTGAAALGLTATVPVVMGMALAGVATDRYLATMGEGWSGTAGGRLSELAATELPGRAWLLPLAALVLAATVAAFARQVAVPGRPVPWLALAAAGGALAALAATLMLLLYPVPVWTVLLVMLAAAAGFGIWTAWRDDPAVALVAGAAILLALGLSAYDEHLMLVAATVGLVLAAGYHLRARHQVFAELAGAAATALLGVACWAAGAVADTEAAWVALIGLLLLAGKALGRAYVPAGWSRAPGAAGVEVGAAATALPLATAGVALSPVVDQPTWTAVYLTVAGATATTMALLRPDRRSLGWLGGLLLAMATWVRLEDIGVREPEPYTLPSALALLVVGGLRLRRDATAGTVSTLGPGLLLALVPSLLWVLDEPQSWRAVLLGLACLGLVVLGTQARWSAPLVVGAAVGVLVVLREAAPYADAVPRWALIGAAGTLLIVLGVTWERRLRDARAVLGYVQRLR